MGRLLAVAAAAALFIASHGAQADERQVLESLKSATTSPTSP
jgi:hypothetical protein